MKLPNGRAAEISTDKIRHYLLSPTHLHGQGKAAAFFRLGYTEASWHRLKLDLLELGRTGDAVRIESPYGEKFRIVGPIVGPNGRSLILVSIWFRPHRGSIPRLVTAYPARKSE